MDTLNFLDVIGYALNAGVVALAYWLLRVRDRLLILENHHEHLQKQVDDSEDNIQQLTKSVQELSQKVGELLAVLRAQGSINGGHD